MRFLLVMMIALICTSCARSSELRRHHGLGLVINFAGTSTSSVKQGVLAESSEGRVVFAGSGIGPKGGGNDTYLGGVGAIPERVRVTWRHGDDVRLDPATGRWKGGTVVGDYTVAVLGRIPKDVFDYAMAGRGRSLRLIFRIEDDGVLLAWDVQEAISLPQFSTGGAWVYAMHGGDLPCEVPRQGGPNCTEGPLESAAWFNPSWVRGR